MTLNSDLKDVNLTLSTKVIYYQTLRFQFHFIYLPLVIFLFFYSKTFFYSFDNKVVREVNDFYLL